MVPDWISLIDIAFLGVALLFGLGGFQKGFAEQVAHIITFLVLGIALFFAYPALFGYFGRLFRDLNETYMMWLILAGLVVLAIVFFVFISKLLANVLKTQISDRSDRAYGFSLGFIRGALVALFLMIFLVILGPSKYHDALGAKSKIGQWVCYELVPRIQPHVTPAALGEQVDKLRETLFHQEDAGMIEGF